MPRDRRVKLVDICPKGLELCEKLIRVADALDAEIMALVSENRLKPLRADLLKIREYISDQLDKE